MSLRFTGNFTETELLYHANARYGAKHIHLLYQDGLFYIGEGVNAQMRLSVISDPANLPSVLHTMIKEAELKREDQLVKEALQAESLDYHTDISAIDLEEFDL